MLIIATSGIELTAAERRCLAHPSVAGVTLFARNFRDRAQVTRLIADMRAASSRPILVCVDQEGGPVQRFRDGFTLLPALIGLGDRYRTDPNEALALAEEHAWLMASEMRAIDVDLSFAPVLDLARGNRAIGERAFDPEPAVVGALGAAYVRGMRMAGMAATLKHFPGHGSVLEDTHFESAVDARDRESLWREDLLPFREAIAAGAEAAMMAHVTFPAVDALPAGYSRRWIVDVLRGEMGFEGVVMSDDIGMFGATSAGSVAARIEAHLAAGCDLVLVCQPDTVPAALAAMETSGARANASVAALAGRAAGDWADLAANPQRDRFIARLRGLPITEMPA